MLGWSFWVLCRCTQSKMCESALSPLVCKTVSARKPLLITLEGDLLLAFLLQENSSLHRCSPQTFSLVSLSFFQHPKDWEKQFWLSHVWGKIEGKKNTFVFRGQLNLEMLRPFCYCNFVKQGQEGKCNPSWWLIEWKFVQAVRTAPQLGNRKCKIVALFVNRTEICFIHREYLEKKK